jgi:flagellar biosynthesis protein FlhF
MQTKRFIAADMSRALDLVRDEFGEDAMILSTQRTAKGVEIVATLEEIKMPEASSLSKNESTAKHSQLQDLQNKSQLAAKPMLANEYSPNTRSNKANVGLASGKTQDELAVELENARRRMLAMQEQENLTLTEWADRHPSQNRQTAGHRATSRYTATSRNTDTETYSNTNSKIGLGVVDSATSKLQAPIQQVPMQATMTSRGDEEISRLHDEITSMRAAFESQLHAMAATQERQYEEQLSTQNIIPITADIKQRLNSLGLNRACNDQVIRSLRMIDDKSLSKESLWGESLARLAHLIPVITNDPIATGGIYAFLGTTGVGKTTTIAKLAARYVIENGAEDVVLLTTDTYKIASHDQLRTLGEILNVHVEVVDNLKLLPEILLSYSKKALVLIDTPGMSYNDPLFKQHLQALNRCRHVQTCLTLSANSQFQMMQATVHSYRIAKPRFCVMTKLDECASLGDTISLLSTNDLPLAYITDGQSVPDDLSIIKPHQLITKAVSLMKTNGILTSHANQSV